MLPVFWMYRKKCKISQKLFPLRWSIAAFLRSVTCDLHWEDVIVLHLLLLGHDYEGAHDLLQAMVVLLQETGAVQVGGHQLLGGGVVQARLVREELAQRFDLENGFKKENKFHAPLFSSFVT